MLRTNVGLTTNVKVVCDSKYNLYLESIDSIPELSLDRFKKFMFNKNNFYDELVPYFFKDVPADIGFAIKYDNDSSNMSTNFSNQYDDIYQMGARDIINNKNYDEEYEYLAPLYIFKHSIPKYFIIFRIDGPGLEKLSKDNFNSDFLGKLKTVKLFDMTKKTALGEWVNNNFRNNKSFPNTSLDIDFRSLEFSKWIGINYESGGFSYKSRFLEESIEDENTLFDFEKMFFDGYKYNKVIQPHIINFNFLFDDTPATKDSLRKWSLNRYSGFYIDDMEVVDTITPFITSSLRDDVAILTGNILFCEFGDPFKLGYKNDADMWVEYLGSFYKVEKYIEYLKSLSISKKKDNLNTIKNDEYITNEIVKYRIISDLNLVGKELFLNKKTCYINSDNQIINIDQTKHVIENITDADINLIEIDGKYHNLYLKNGYLTLNTDYGFNFKSEYRLEYFINSPDPDYYNYIDLSISNLNSPISFKIFKIRFTDIKDFDTQIVDNEYSKFEYEKISEITETEEPKMYTTDIRNNSNPASYNDYIYKEDVILLPTSSDYTANLETFRIVDNNLSEIWRKNSTYCRFGFQNSNSVSDYPYLLNNNDIHENFNRCADVNYLTPNRKLRNLDYFYTINSGTTSYTHHSLHVEKNYNSEQDSSFIFEVDKYLNIGYTKDYFSYFFSATQSFQSGKVIKNVKKFSYFNSGDSDIPNVTLFKGLKFKLFEADSLKRDDIKITDINLQSSNKFQDYKFSILLSQNLQKVENSTLVDSVKWGKFVNVEDASGFLSFKTSETELPSNIKVGDLLDIKQDYPIFQKEYNGITTVTSISILPSGGFGFITNKLFDLTPSYEISGYYKINFKWKKIKNWELGIDYYLGDIVIYDDILYNVISNNNIEVPTNNPSNLPEYNLYSGYQPFWTPEQSSVEWVYRQGDYYVKSGNVGIDFWQNRTTSNFVIWKGRFYKRIVPSDYRPNERNRQNDMSELDKYWKEVPNPNDWYAYDNDDINSYTDESIWNQIPLYNKEESYVIDDFVVDNNILWKCIENTDIDDVPDKISEYWLRTYSFEPDTDIIYSTNNNPFIKIGESYYLCEFNNGNTLESGITIYINNKWDNVLVNININDNTTENLENCERDILYNISNTRLTASNFIRQINDLDSKYDFSDYTSYVVINKDGSFKKYNFNNIENLPYMLICEGPDDFELRNNSLIYKSNSIKDKKLNPSKYLVNGVIDSLSKINYYNNISLGYEIDRNFNSDVFGINYNGRRNISISNNPGILPKSNSNITETFYRHSGDYMPIFYDIELFELNSNNFRFDDSLTFFGIIKHRVVSKINRKENILKLKDSDIKSIYPMIDEFGYLTTDSFIFKSTWDYEYHVECNIKK